MLVGHDTKYEVPDKCDGCSRLGKASQQGDTCCRCPVFNCSLSPDTDGNMSCLVEPDDYRDDWAKSYHDWFKEQGLVK